MIKSEETSYKQGYIQNQSLSSCFIVPICSRLNLAKVPEIQPFQSLTRKLPSESTLENRQKYYSCELQRKKSRDYFISVYHLQHQRRIKTLFTIKKENDSKMEGKFALSDIDTLKQTQAYLENAQSNFSVNNFKLPFILHPCHHLLQFATKALNRIDFSDLLSKACQQKMIANAESRNLQLAIPSTFQNSTLCRLWRTFNPVSLFASCFKDILIHRLRQTIINKHFKPIIVYQRQRWKVSVSIAAIIFRFNQRHPPQPFSIKCAKSIFYQVQEENLSIPSNISPIRSPQIVPQSLNGTLSSSSDRLLVFAMPEQQEAFRLPERPEEQQEEEPSNRSQVLPIECQEQSVEPAEEDD